jgi:hypothetical protein
MHTHKNASKSDASKFQKSTNASVNDIVNKKKLLTIRWVVDGKRTPRWVAGETESSAVLS